MEKDVICPICISILYHPVKLPCNHVFCHNCIFEAVSQTAYQCPICRFRLSNWLRKIKDLKYAINNDEERYLRKLFPVYYSEKDLGKSPCLSTSEQQSLDILRNKNRAFNRIQSSPGSIHSEYLNELAKSSHERALEEKKNEEASLALAFQLLAEDGLYGGTSNETDVVPAAKLDSTPISIHRNSQQVRPPRTLLDYVVDNITPKRDAEVVDSLLRRDEEFARKLQAKYDKLVIKPKVNAYHTKRSKTTLKPR